MSERTAVIYYSVYGSTKQYAEWIAEALGADLYPGNKVKISALSQYDRLIFGGGLYAESIGGVKKLTKNLDKLEEKDIVFFSVGLSTVTDEVIKHILDHNFSPELQKKVKFFALRGAFDFEKLSFIHKLMMNMFKKIILKKGNDMSEDDKQMLQSYHTPVSFVDKKNIEPILDYVKGE